VGLGVLAVANTTTSSGAEVPIPVFVNVTNSTPSQPKRQDPDDSLEPPSKAPVPVISITKPPAPLPVDLPTRDDITLDPDSETLHPDDLESGGPLMEDSLLSKSEQEDVTPLTQRAPIMSPEDAGPSPSTARAPVDPLSKVSNLLDDSLPTLAASPMKPSSSAGLSPRDASPPPLVTVGNSPMDDGDESDPEHGKSASTVRLVGRDAEVGRSKSDEDDHVLAGIASGSDVEVGGSIG
jgi:hypothetical protein